MNSKNLLFYTGATNFFHNYIPLYFLFGALEHPGASFEFLVRDVPRMLAVHGESLERIAALSGSVYYLHDVGGNQFEKKPMMENSYRFLIQPFLQSEYVYIGDIDILLAENVLERHRLFVDSGLPYYNQVRPGTNRLTGLHLARYSEMYPLHRDIWDYANLNDEEILYKSYEIRGALHPKGLDLLQAELGRPNCGIHASLNRLPFSMSHERPGWGIYSSALKKLTLHFDLDDEVRAAIQSMYQGSRMIFMNLVVIAKGLRQMSSEERGFFLLKDTQLRMDS